MLRIKQKDRIESLLRGDKNPFKILILDEYTRDMLSAILRISSLRDCGVTAHFMIDDPRSKISEIPAIYFLSTAKGLEKEIFDDLYNTYSLHLTTRFKREELEALAGASSKRQNASKITSIFDQYLHFTAIENDFFTLNLTDSFVNRNQEHEIESAVSALFSIAFTLGEAPFIVSDNKRIAEQLSRQIKNTRCFKSTIKKPLFIVLDREFDVFTPTAHVMEYTALIHDLFGIQSNKVRIGSDEYDIDVDSSFYTENKARDFPSVADTVEKELTIYKKEMAKRSLTDKSDKAEIQRALEETPMLQKKNEIISSHLNICMKILEAVKERKLDDFYQMEQAFNRDEIMELSEHGDENDIIRLCISLVNTKFNDLIAPLLEKRKINTDLKFFTAKAKAANLTEKMKNLIFKKEGPLCAAIRDVMQQVEKQTYNREVYDPMGNGIFLSEISSVVVYVHGGVTYNELSDVNELNKGWNMPFILGGSEILSATTFLEQVNKLTENK
ncbi:sec1 family domain-containing protein 1 [Enteropsectra breve]|nr:sec1 family domain-containing protein 1 [Enteropsectra breve]